MGSLRNCYNNFGSLKIYHLFMFNCFTSGDSEALRFWSKCREISVGEYMKMYKVSGSVERDYLRLKSEL